MKNWKRTFPKERHRKPCIMRGCKHRIADDLIFCADHYRKIPTDFRMDMLRAFLVSPEEYRAAVKRAVVFLGDKQPKPIPAEPLYG